MRIVQEKVNNENFIDLVLTERELDSIKEYMLFSNTCYIEDIPINIGIKIACNDEIDEDF